MILARRSIGWMSIDPEGFDQNFEGRLRKARANQIESFLLRQRFTTCGLRPARTRNS